MELNVSRVKSEKVRVFFGVSPPRCCDGFRMLNLSGAGVNIDLIKLVCLVTW